MSKRLVIIAIVLLVPMMIFAGTNKFEAAKAITNPDNTIVVPLEITNEYDLAAMDIPLRFSEGITLKEVNFTNTRVDYFDFKSAGINNEKHTVVIGLLPQLSKGYKPKLAPGTGVIANLVFEIDDPSITDITLEAIELKNPNHSLTFVYHEGKDRTIRMLEPAFSSTTVSLVNSGSGLPETFALYQNYPNPFNPATQISFDLPVASDVELTIFNVLGQKVSTIIDKEMEAGNHVIEWDASNYSSGVYFYRVSAENFTETKKMLMLK